MQGAGAVADFLIDRKIILNLHPASFVLLGEPCCLEIRRPVGLPAQSRRVSASDCSMQQERVLFRPTCKPN